MQNFQLITIGKVIQWAANQQIDLLLDYEHKWGFSSKEIIWKTYENQIRKELPKHINSKNISEELQSYLLKFLKV